MRLANTLGLLLALTSLGLACTRPPSGGPALAATATAAAPVPAGPSPTGEVPCVDNILIQSGKVTPERLTVPERCAVMWTNRDDRTVQIQGTDFLLGEMGKDQSWAHTYRDPGTFDWVDAKDPTIKGTVIVRPR